MVGREVEEIEALLFRREGGWVEFFLAVQFLFTDDVA